MNSFPEGTAKIRVVIVGGWSPGPLNHLKAVLLLEQSKLQQGINNNHCYCEIIEPRTLRSWMPPFPGRWCCHPLLVVTALMLGMTVFAAILTTTIFRAIVFWLLAVFGARCLVGVAVKMSIDRSIQEIQMELEGPHNNNDNNNNEPPRVLLIGFSWGGAIVAEMIAKGLVGTNDNNSHVSALLIAPTTSWVGKLAYGGDAATRIATSGITTRMPPTQSIIVVHGIYDTTFCPHPNRWMDVPGVDLRILPDNHAFLSPRSLEFLEGILLGCTQRRQARNSPDSDNGAGTDRWTQ